MTLIYDMSLWPRRDQGCIVIRADGQWLIKLYVSSDEASITVRELQPAPRDIVLSRDPAADNGVRAIYAVIDRLD